MFRIIAFAATIATVSIIGFASVSEAKSPNSSLVIVDGDRGRVVYDDGIDDGACVFRRVFSGYDYWGNPRFRKVYQCFR